MTITDIARHAAPIRHWSQGPFHHIEGLDPEVDIFPASDTQIGVFDIDDEVTPVAGPFAGHVGVVDELDLDDDEKPFRVAFGNTVAWFAASDLKPAGGAR